MQILKTTDVFTPGSQPTYTYYARPTLNLEQSLLHAINTRGIITTVSGPSKSGKTVLCETVIGINSMLLVTGGGTPSEASFWARIRTKLKAPSSSSMSAQTTESQETQASLKTGLNLIAQGELAFQGKAGHADQHEATLQFEGLSGVDLLHEVTKAGKTLVVDDFHYIERDIQTSIVEQFKEAARAGCTIMVVSVPHRADDPIRANPELRGRIRLIEVPYWSQEDLRNIPALGFPKLNVQPEPSIISRFAAESLSSPQLMQALCLELCLSEGIYENQPEARKLVFNDEKITKVLQTIATTSSGQTAIYILEKGPRVRGTERNNYQLLDGTTGDVYTVVLKAMGSGEPKLSLTYQEIRDRVGAITRGEPPSGSSIVSTLTKMDELAREMKEDRILEWDPEKETLNFPDPYFLYYLRWKA